MREVRCRAVQGVFGLQTQRQGCAHAKRTVMVRRSKYSRAGKDSEVMFGLDWRTICG